jgi:hypothetical protein
MVLYEPNYELHFLMSKDDENFCMDSDYAVFQGQELSTPY